jgi:hypothetical protein
VAVACVAGEVVGAAAWGTLAADDVARLRSRFELDSSSGGNIELSLCVLNPIFEPHAPAFLAAVLRLATAGASGRLLYRAVPGSPPPPCVAAAMEQAAPRQRPGAAAVEHDAPAGPLHVFAKGLAPRRRVHTRVSCCLMGQRSLAVRADSSVPLGWDVWRRSWLVPGCHSPLQIVLAGASDTSLGCLEALLTGVRHRGTLYTHVTLASSGGIAGAGDTSWAGCGAGYAPEALAGLGVGASAAVVEGALVGLDRRERLALLGGGGALPYDLLAVATGLRVGGVPA